jgi:hypothetical protein
MAWPKRANQRQPKKANPWANVLGAVLTKEPAALHIRRGAVGTDWSRVMSPQDVNRNYTRSIRIENESSATYLDVGFSKEQPDTYFCRIPASSGDDNNYRHFRLGRNGLTIWLRAGATSTAYQYQMEAY